MILAMGWSGPSTRSRPASADVAAQLVANPVHQNTPTGVATKVAYTMNTTPPHLYGDGALLAR